MSLARGVVDRMTFGAADKAGKETANEEDGGKTASSGAGGFPGHAGLGGQLASLSMAGGGAGDESSLTYNSETQEFAMEEVPVECPSAMGCWGLARPLSPNESAAATESIGQAAIMVIPVARVLQVFRIFSRASSAIGAAGNQGAAAKALWSSLNELPANQRLIAFAFDKFAPRIAGRFSGWNFKRSLQADGSILYSGDFHLLIINRAGQIFRGPTQNFNLGKVVTPK